MVEFTIKATAVWKPENESKSNPLPAGWIVSCRNPEIETKRFDDYEEAFQVFQEGLTENFVKVLIPNGCPEIDVEDPIFKGKTTSCDTSGDQFSLVCDPDEIKITWLITISHQVNRTLDEFNQGVQEILEEERVASQEGV